MLGYDEPDHLDNPQTSSAFRPTDGGGRDRCVGWRNCSSDFAIALPSRDVPSAHLRGTAFVSFREHSSEGAGPAYIPNRRLGSRIRPVCGGLYLPGAATDASCGECIRFRAFAPWSPSLQLAGMRRSPYEEPGRALRLAQCWHRLERHALGWRGWYARHQGLRWHHDGARSGQLRLFDMPAAAVDWGKAEITMPPERMAIALSIIAEQWRCDEPM
jgi:hypothetical protein